MSARLLIALLMLSACEQPRTQMIVVISNGGLHVPDDVDALHVSVTDTAGPTLVYDSIALGLCAGAPGPSCYSLPLTIGLVPGSQTGHVVEVRVDALAAGKTVISDAAKFTFADQTTERLDFVLRDSCLATKCGAMDQACLESGQCGALMPTVVSGALVLDGGNADAGGRWTPVTSGTTSALHAIGGSKNDVWVVGDAALVLHSTDGETWTPIAVGGTESLTGVWTPSPGQAYVTGAEGGVYLIAGSPPMVTAGMAPTGRLFAAGGNATKAFVSGGGASQILSAPLGQLTFTAATLPPDIGDVRGLAVSGTTIFAVGDSGILHSADNGATWKAESAAQSLRAIWSAGGTLFAVGQAGAWRLDSGAGAWVAGDATLSANGVWGADASDVFAVGDQGRVYRSRDQGASWHTELSNPDLALNAVWGWDADHIWAAGDNGVLLRR